MPDESGISLDQALLGRVVIALEQQLALLDEAGAMIAAAHVSAAIEHLRLDLMCEQLLPKTRH